MHARIFQDRIDHVFSEATRPVSTSRTAPHVALDIDLDVFRTGDAKRRRTILELIRRHAGAARIVTIATSPFFLNQRRAIALAKRVVAVIESCGPGKHDG